MTPKRNPTEICFNLFGFHCDNPREICVHSVVQCMMHTGYREPHRTWTWLLLLVYNRVIVDCLLFLTSSLHTVGCRLIYAWKENEIYEEKTTSQFYAHVFAKEDSSIYVQNEAKQQKQKQQQRKYVVFFRWFSS